MQARISQRLKSITFEIFSSVPVHSNCFYFLKSLDSSLWGKQITIFCGFWSTVHFLEKHYTHYIKGMGLLTWLLWVVQRDWRNFSTKSGSCLCRFLQKSRTQKHCKYIHKLYHHYYVRKNLDFSDGIYWLALYRQ